MSKHVVAVPDESQVVKFRNQDYEKILSWCSKHGVPWEDPKFSPDIGNLTWKRPWEIVPSPCLLLEGAKSYDVRQGVLGNGYMTVAMQALTHWPELLQWVVPADQQCSRDRGIVHFRIWQLGTWYDICVDDRLPTREGKLAYTHSRDENVFWFALLEKAYAKLHGSYKILERGHSADAMVDFTGGLSEDIFLELPLEGFGKRLLNAYHKNLLMCCALSGSNQRPRDSVNILKDAHHYTVTKVQRVGANTIVARLKDPIDQESELSLDPNIQSFDLEVDNDREFWVTETYFKDNFISLSICHQSPATFMNSGDKFVLTESWWVNTFKGEWVRGVSAGGRDALTIHTNHQYRITLVEPDRDNKSGLCSMVISLMQKPKTRRLEWNLEYKLFKLESPTSKPLLLGPQFFADEEVHNLGIRSEVNAREIVNRHSCYPGVYCIIPCTKERNEEGEFILRAFTKRKVKMEKCDKRVSVVDGLEVVDAVLNIKSPVAEESKTEEDIAKLFIKVADKDMTVDWEGLKAILESQFEEHPSFVKRLCNLFTHAASSLVEYLYWHLRSPTPEHKLTQFSKELCRKLISYKDEANSGRIGFDEFDELWSDVCRWKLIFRIYCTTGGLLEPESLGTALEKVGFALNQEILGTLIHRYADEEGKLALDDFISCIITLHMDLSNFVNLDRKNTGKAVVTLNEWIKNAFFTRQNM